ncbi:hypothetical protein BpHYR1_025959 [Brachionus plicatilis]|uniref:Uncharacterized protein n=1 Tax=Brachionus plicatilis TaxID=10195 RepID=A0A3M7SMK0_BRAPC|nr:hypothetical protein BpHYR1_025959 [Brachionus plicatilis]
MDHLLRKLSDSIEKHGLFISLMYLYYNIKIKNEFNIVQIVRLLRKTHPRLLNKQEYYDYLYNFCLSDNLNYFCVISIRQRSIEWYHLNLVGQKTTASRNF